MAEPIPRWKAYALSLLTLLVPGLSHWFLGKRRRALLLFLIVAATFVVGIALKGALFSFGAPNWLYRLGAIAESGLGLPYLVGILASIAKLDPAESASLMFGYGNVFLVTSGLMNMLLIMDAFDIAVGRKD